MRISDKGLHIIKEFEGYERKLPDGSCTAYQDYLGNDKYDIPTIGWGCTEGVKMGDIWTLAQAEEGLRREVSKFEDAVSSLVKFVPTQNQFDALVSFTYNEGAGALERSSLLRKANQGDFQGAAQAFLLYNKAQGNTLSGLTRRRHMEASLFLETNKDESPVADDPSALAILAKSRTVKAGGAIVTAGAGELSTSLQNSNVVDTADSTKTLLEQLVSYFPQLTTVLGVVIIAIGAYVIYRRCMDHKETGR